MSSVIASDSEANLSAPPGDCFGLQAPGHVGIKPRPRNDSKPPLVHMVKISPQHAWIQRAGSI